MTNSDSNYYQFHNHLKSGFSWWRR